MALVISKERNVSTEQLEALGIIVIEQFVTLIIVFLALQKWDAGCMEKEKMTYVF